jgi:hypothetical protein
MTPTSLWNQYRDELANDPLLVLGLTAALIALATTPLAFAVLGRLDWFKARRGRVLLRPAFSSIVVGMILVMSIPAIFAAMVLKSRSFDKNRYEFDPNKTWSVLEQGRGYETLQAADRAVRDKDIELGIIRKDLVNNVKKLDEAMLALRAVAGTSPAVAQRFPSVLQSLAGVRKSVGLDGPQQLQDFTAPPVDLRAMAANNAGAAAPVAATPTIVAAPVPAQAAPAGEGLSPAQVEGELAGVPEPQRGIAAMLPMTGLPPGWTIGKSGEKHLETFNADNLYEKIDGRAESFLQYGVKGMAYAFYHPTGDPNNELQLYVFEMGDSLKALGKYGSEKPEEFQPVSIGDQGYSTAGSTLFYAGKYYTQIVSTADDPKFAAFALELARRVVARQKPGAGGASGTATAAGTSPPAAKPAESGETAEAKPSAEAKPASEAKPAAVEVTPATYFGLLPAKGRDGEPKYVAQDAFGYSFFSDVFMADYKEGTATWQGFLRPYRDAQEAKAVFQKYLEGVKKDGAEIKTIAAEGADEIVVSTNIGLVDVVFRKGNTVAGANGATAAPPAEAYARAMAKALPASVPTLEAGK